MDWDGCSWWLNSVIDFSCLTFGGGGLSRLFKPTKLGVTETSHVQKLVQFRYD